MIVWDSEYCRAYDFREGFLKEEQLFGMREEVFVAL